MKVLRDTALAGAEVDRFKLEASAAAALRHPHIVGIHEIGEHGGTHFFSMDYVAGPSLAAVLREGPLPARKAATLMGKIAQAIHHAHSQGVLHRDLKPANVLLDPSGEPMVTDFGLAKHDAADLGLTVSGQVLGTPAYMAPEQAEGRSKECDARTDVYGLGALLYHMAAGRAPFAGDSHVVVMQQVMKDEPVSVRLLNPSIPRDFETICAKAMAKDAPRRYQTALAMAEDVQRFLDGKPVLARPVGALGKTWRWARRHRAVAAALLMTVVSLTTAALVSFVSAQRMKASRDAESAARNAAESLMKDMLVGMRKKLQPLNKIELLDDNATAAEKYFDALPPPHSALTEQHRAAMPETRADVFAARGDLAAAIAKQRASQEIVERLLRAAPGNPALLNDAAQALAWLHRRQGRASDTLPMLARSHELHQALALVQSGNASVRHAAALSTCSYAEALTHAGRKEEACKLIEPLHASPPTPDETDVIALERAAELHIHLGDALWYAGHPEKANTGFPQALAFAEKAKALQPGNLRYQRRLITSLERTTDAQLENNDHAAAQQTVARRLVISEQIAAADPSNLRHRYAIVTHWLDEAMLVKESDYPAAKNAYARALTLSQSLAKADAKNFDYRRNIVIIHLNESNLHLFHRDFPAARQSQTAANAAMSKDFPGNTSVQRDADMIANTLKDIEAAEQAG